MRKTATLLACLVTLALGAWNASATTKADAKALTERGVAHCLEVGQEQCLTDFTENTDGKWVDGSLYVFAIGLDGMTRAHGAKKSLIGKNLSKIKDKKGKLFMKEMIDIAKSKGEGWVLYYWPDPTTKKLRPKASFIKRVADDDYFLGVGIYR